MRRILMFFVCLFALTAIAIAQSEQQSSSSTAKQCESDALKSKDILTLGVSLITLCFSLYAILKKKREEERTIRNQLTDIIGKLNDVATEHDTLIYETKDKKRDDYTQRIFMRLGDRTRFLLRQTIFLIKKIPNLVTDMEYVVVAFTSAEIGDLVNADDYWQKAIAVASNSIQKGEHLSAYARFLFNQGDIEEGRMKFQQSIETFKDKVEVKTQARKDLILSYLGEIHARWARAEAEYAPQDGKVKRHLDESRKFYEAIRNQSHKKDGLNNLNAVMSSIPRQQQKIERQSDSP